MMSIHQKPFIATISQYLNTEFVQPKTAQIEARNHTQGTTVIVQPLAAPICPSQQLDKCLKYWS